MEPDLGMPLDGGFLPTLSSGASREEQTVALNDVITRLNNLLKAQVFSDSSSKRYVQGYSPGRWPGGDFGIAISAEGDDVLTVDFEDLIFAWDFSTNQQYVRGGSQTFYDATTGKTALSIGKAEDNNMAFKTYDTNRIPMGLFGQSPKDRTGGVFTVGPGKNVDTKLKES